MLELLQITLRGFISLINTNQYYVTDHEDGLGRVLILKTAWSDSMKSVIEDEAIDVLRLSQSAGWSDEDISFVSGLKTLRGVEVYSWKVKDVTPLESLRNLELIGLQCEFNKAPDFSTFKKLQICKLLWRPTAAGIFSCISLRLLNIQNYPSEDFRAIEGLVNLRELEITSRRLVSLHGIEGLRQLLRLDLADCPKLESLAGLESCGDLAEIRIENCKRFYSIDMLGELKLVKKIYLIDCGKIKTLQPISGCKQLQSILLIGSTIVVDGDMTPLLLIPTLKDVAFVDRRHYSHKCDYIEAAIA